MWPQPYFVWFSVWIRLNFSFFNALDSNWYKSYTSRSMQVQCWHVCTLVFDCQYAFAAAHRWTRAGGKTESCISLFCFSSFKFSLFSKSDAFHNKTIFSSSSSDSNLQRFQFLTGYGPVLNHLGSLWVIFNQCFSDSITTKINREQRRVSVSTARRQVQRQV